MSTVEVNKITPVSGGTSLQIGESGDTTNIVGTLQNNGASVGVAGISSSADATAITIDSGERVGINSSNMSSLDAEANQLVVGSGSGNQGLTVYSDGSSSGSIFFANGTAGAQPKQGQIVYEQNNSTMLLKTANATAMSIDGSGRILTPLNVMFSAYASASQSITNYSDNDVVFGGEDFDIGSNFASNTFTAPVAGKYIFFVKLQVADSAGWIKPKLVPSGKQYSWFMNPGQDDMSPAWSQIVDMAANDTCKVTIVADDNNYTIVGASGSTYHQTTFSGYLLG